MTYEIPGESRDPASNLSVSWRVVAIVAALVTISSLATLIIVANIVESDVLTSVALILAILAFTIQIVVFIADFAMSSRREREATELNSRTQVLLAKIEQKADTTNQAVSGQMQRMLDSLLAREKKASQSEFGDSAKAELTREILFELRRDLLSQVASEVPKTNAVSPVGVSRTQKLRQWLPTAILRRLAREQALLDWSDEELEMLLDFVDDVVTSESGGLPEGIFLEMIGDREGLARLQRERLVEPASGLSSAALALTSKGLAYARVLVAPDPIPADALELLPWLAEVRSSVAGQRRPAFDSE